MTGIVQKRVRDRTLPMPESGALGAAMLSLHKYLHHDQNERALAETFLDTIGALFPHRIFGMRIASPRDFEGVRGYLRGGSFHADALARLTIDEPEAQRAQLKPAVISSAALAVQARWQPPFAPACSGFALALATRGELYGTFDVGYPLGRDMSHWDRPLLEPFANALALAIGQQWLTGQCRALQDERDQLIAASDCFHLTLDHNFCILSANQRVASLVGKRVSELVGTDIRQITANGMRTALTSLLSDLVNSADAPLTLEFAFETDPTPIGWKVVTTRHPQLPPRYSLLGRPTV